MLSCLAILPVMLFFKPGNAGDAPYQADLERGAILYQEACASCHGVNLEGQPDWRQRRADGRLPAPPHDETGHTWHHSDRILFLITKYGSERMVGGGYESDMQGFGDRYDDHQIRDILNWIKSRWPAREREIQENINAQDP